MADSTNKTGETSKTVGKTKVRAEKPTGTIENNGLIKNLFFLTAESCLIPSTTISLKYPTEGENVTVNSVAWNMGGVDAENVKVEFLIDGVSVENKTVNVSMLSETNIAFKWTAENGKTHNLTVKADANNSADEWNESNNEFIINFDNNN
jgi:subtilase family serine protease